MTSPNRPALEVTKWTWALFAAVIGAGVVWTVLQVCIAAGWLFPSVPMASAVVFAVLSLGAFVLSLVTRKRARHWRRGAVPLLAGGKALVLAGAALVGGYSVLAAFNFRLEVPLPRETFVAATISAVSAAVLIASGYLLQHACRIPPDDDSPPK
jgi:magnesium-transporting ATPase (P-type)